MPATGSSSSQGVTNHKSPRSRASATWAGLSSPHHVVEQYQANLTSSKPLDERLAEYEAMLTDDAILMVNFDRDQQPPPTVEGEVPMPRVLQHKQNLLAFQRAAYKANTWTHLKFEVVSTQQEPLLATIVGRGTHIVEKKPENKTVYVQAIETFTVRRQSRTDPWKISSVAFIDYVYDGTCTFAAIKL